MPEGRIVHRVETVLLSAHAEGPGERFLPAGRRPVGEYGESPGVVHQVGDHGRVVDIHRLAVFHVEAPADSVIGVEEAAVYTRQDLLSLGPAPVAEHGQGLPFVVTVVVVAVSVGVGNQLVGHGAVQFDTRILEVDFQDMDMPGNIDAVVVVVGGPPVQLACFHGLPVIVGIQGPVHRVRFQVIAGLVVDHGILHHGRTVPDKTISVVGGDIGLGAVVGTQPARPVIAFLLAGDGSVIGTVRDDAGIVPHDAALLGGNRDGNVAVVDAAFALQFSSQGAVGVDIAGDTADDQVVPGGGRPRHDEVCIVGDTVHLDGFSPADNPAGPDLPRGIAGKGHLAAVIAESQLLDGDSRRAANEAGHRVFIQVHGPVDILDGTVVPVDAVLQRHGLCPGGNPFLDGGGVDVVQELDHAVHQERGDGSFPIDGFGESHEVFRRGNAPPGDGGRPVARRLVDGDGDRLLPQVGNSDLRGPGLRSLVLLAVDGQRGAALVGFPRRRLDFGPGSGTARVPVRRGHDGERFDFTEARDGLGGR